MHISPLNIQEKSTPGQYRLLHNLSFPYDDSSVNSCIPESCKHVTYSSLQDAVELILALGKGCFLAKCDIKSAFRLLQVAPSDHHYLGFMFDDMYYYDTVMLMGCALSCRSFERFSRALHWISQNVFDCGHSIQYLDDYLFLGLSRQIVLDSLAKFARICEKLGVPLAPEKTRALTQY